MIKIGLIICLVVVCFFLGYRWWKQRSVVATTPVLQDRQRIEIDLNKHSLTVETVTQPASIELGLSGRSSIGADGMLFIFNRDQETKFWMKEMQFDLDMVWLRDGQVVGVTANVPAPSPNIQRQALPLYSSPGLVDMVLEIPAGKAAEWQIVTGTNLKFK